MRQRTEQLRLLDVHDTSPKTLSPEAMSQELACELVMCLFLGDFALNKWQEEFINRLYQHRHKTITFPQRRVIYGMAFKFRLL